MTSSIKKRVFEQIADVEIAIEMIAHPLRRSRYELFQIPPVDDFKLKIKLVQTLPLEGSSS
jgi:hypothetical protein